MDLYKHLLSQIAWSRETFGPMGLQGIIHHLEEEIEEVKQEPENLEEWVDVILLGFDGAWRSGHTAREIVEAINQKFKKNQKRQWPGWTTQDRDQKIKHKENWPYCYKEESFSTPGWCAVCGKHRSAHKLAIEELRGKPNESSNERHKSKS